jgi:hypothetical protein
MSFAGQHIAADVTLRPDETAHALFTVRDISGDNRSNLDDRARARSARRDLRSGTPSRRGRTERCARRRPMIPASTIASSVERTNLERSGFLHGHVRRFGADCGFGTVKTIRTASGPSIGSSNVLCSIAAYFTASRHGFTAFDDSTITPRPPCTPMNRFEPCGAG